MANLLDLAERVRNSLQQKMVSPIPQRDQQALKQQATKPSIFSYAPQVPQYLAKQFNTNTVQPLQRAFQQNELARIAYQRSPVGKFQTGLQNVVNGIPKVAGTMAYNYGKSALQAAPQILPSIAKVSPPGQALLNLQGKSPQITDTYNALKGVGYVATPGTNILGGMFNVGVQGVGNKLQGKPFFQNYGESFGKGVDQTAAYGPVRLKTPNVQFLTSNPRLSSAIGSAIKGGVENAALATIRPLEENETRTRAIINDTLFGAGFEGTLGFLTPVKQQALQKALNEPVRNKAGRIIDPSTKQYVTELKKKVFRYVGDLEQLSKADSDRLDKVIAKGLKEAQTVWGDQSGFARLDLGLSKDAQAPVSDITKEANAAIKESKVTIENLEKQLASTTKNAPGRKYLRDRIKAEKGIIEFYQKKLPTPPAPVSGTNVNKALADTARSYGVDVVIGNNEKQLADWTSTQILSGNKNVSDHLSRVAKAGEPISISKYIKDKYQKPNAAPVSGAGTKPVLKLKQNTGERFVPGKQRINIIADDKGNLLPIKGNKSLSGSKNQDLVERFNEIIQSKRTEQPSSPLLLEPSTKYKFGQKLERNAQPKQTPDEMMAMKTLRDKRMAENPAYWEQYYGKKLNSEVLSDEELAMRQLRTQAEPMGQTAPQSVASATTEQVKTAPSQVQSGGQGVSGTSSQTNPSNPSIPPNDTDLIAKLTQALREAKPLRNAQEALYRKARSQKFARMMGARGKMGGEKGFYSELGALKGEMPKVDYESVRGQFDQASVDRLFNILKENKVLDEWDKITAQTGLSKILGAEGGSVPTKGEIQKLYQVFGKEFTEALLSKRSLFSRMSEAGMQLYNLPRSIMAGAGDFSGTLMQNLLFAYRHPVMTAKNFGKELQFFANEQAFKLSQQEIYQRPNRDLYKKAKLSLTDLSPVMDNREEAFMAPIAEKIPVLGGLIKRSGRAYTGFLNKMRADVFDQMVDSYKNSGGDIEDERFLKSLGEFINGATGRGDLGALEKSASLLSQILFSARKLAATVQMINPVFYIKADPFVRKEALKTMAAFMGGGLLITSLADMAGAEVSKDPTSADFGKIKIGNTRFNVWGSYQQIAVLMARLYKGYATSSTTGKKMTLGDESNPYSPTRLDLLTRFFENKEHPTLSLIMSALRGTNGIGEPFNLPKETLSLFIPMILADSYDLYQEHGPKGLLGTIPSILGIPSQTYGRQVPNMETTPTGKPTIKLKNAPGLEDAIINKVTNKPVSNIPENQWESVVKAKQDESMKKYKITEAVDELRKSGGSTVVDGNTFVYINDKGEAKSVDLNFQPKEPKLTGIEVLDKKLKSKYSTEITNKVNDVIELYENGFINEEQAGTAITALEELRAKSKGPKKINIKITKSSAPKPNFKLKLSKPKQVSLKKLPKLKVTKSKKIKLKI